MLEPGKLLSTMDAKVWADEFMETKARLGEKEFDHAMMLAWFANAIMAGFDEATRRQHATIADLQGQLKTAQAPRMYDCGSCAIGKGFEQRVAQLEQDSKKASTDYEACRNALDKTVGELTTLQADHATLLGLLATIAPYVASWLQETYGDDYVNHPEWKQVEASLPAPPAQDGGK